MDKVFLDTETTGFAPGNITQLAMINETDSGEVIAYNYFFEVDYISEGAIELNNRDLDFYKEASGGLRFKDYSDRVMNILHNKAWVAHNLSFDEKFISTELWRNNKVAKPAYRLDTMKFFKDICKIPNKSGRGIKNPKLIELADFYNVDNNKVKEYCEKLFYSDDSIDFHDARFDTTMLFVIFHIYNDSLYGSTIWKDTFCKR